MPRLRSIEIAQTREDRRRFEEDLKAAFPRIRFILKTIVDPGEEPRITYVDSTWNLPWQGPENLTVWVEPEDWAPTWALAETPSLSRPGRLYCVNQPPLSFSMYQMNDPRRWYPARPLAGNATKRALCRCECIRRDWIGGYWDENQPEVRRFLDKVIRLLKKRASNSIIGVDFETGKALHPPPAKGDSRIWLGEDTVAWLRGAPNRFADNDLRPGDEYETYYWPLPTRMDEQGYAIY